jgi:mono/diheme cytochrome c family protein
MTSERAAIAFVLAAALVGAVGGCADFSRGPAPVGVDAGASEGGSADAAASFADVEAILTGNCQRCHSMGGEAGDTTFLLTGDAAADHATVMNFVDVNAPSASRLLAKMSGNGHGGGTVFAAGTPEYQTVLHWIQEGAPQ